MQWKTNDDEEFDTYICQPFLTSTESDQLIKKLRARGFFKAMAYDAQLGGWCLLSSLPPDHAEVLRRKRDEAVDPNKSGMKEVKQAKNFGLDVGVATELARETIERLGETKGILSDSQTEALEAASDKLEQYDHAADAVGTAKTVAREVGKAARDASAKGSKTTTPKDAGGADDASDEVAVPKASRCSACSLM